MGQRENAFKNWIYKMGHLNVAVKIGTTERNVWWWSSGITMPKAIHMQKIVRISQGEVTYEDIIDGHIKAKALKVKRGN